MGNQNNREIYADKIYSDILFYKETQECKKLSLFTPVRSEERRVGKECRFQRQFLKSDNSLNHCSTG